MFRLPLVVYAAVLLVIGCGKEVNAVEDEGASFGIVFDTTNSMNPELQQVKRSAILVLENALNRTGQPIEDFVFASFNDPDVPEAQVTKDPNEFRGFLSGITAGAPPTNTDYPEMCFSGLLNALKMVRPRGTSLAGAGSEANFKAVAEQRKSRSLVVVFTDAGPKDRHLLPQILNLVRQKEVVVLFVLSGTDDPAGIDDEEYLQVASISSGQVLNLDKFHVSVVMKYLDNLLQTSKVNIVAVDKKGGSTDEYPVVVDKTINEITASIAGQNSKITVKNPEGKIETDIHKVEMLINTDTAKVVRVNKPEPGVWNITTSSTADHTFRLTGVSKVDFQYGFSRHKAVSLNNTFQLPLKGVENRITISSADPNVVRRIVKIEIIALNGTSMFTLDAASISAKRGIFRSEPFTPPNDSPFYIATTAETQDGQLIQRTSKTGVSPAPPLPEMLKMEDETGSGIRQTQPTFITAAGVLLFISTWTEFQL